MSVKVGPRDAQGMAPTMGPSLCRLIYGLKSYELISTVVIIIHVKVQLNLLFIKDSYPKSKEVQYRLINYCKQESGTLNLQAHLKRFYKRSSAQGRHYYIVQFSRLQFICFRTKLNLLNISMQAHRGKKANLAGNINIECKVWVTCIKQLLFSGHKKVTYMGQELARGPQN